ncbi:universal stress protein [Salinimicrobium sp. GXAS 041]|uniref:universal stress protein n=1 Tax=Salinimicrobium sp. GXAS 041 TaxID=3400806 RepID=UPI003C721E80
MRTILLPTDFSKNSLNAIYYALDMFRPDDCRFILLHAYSVNGYDPESKLSAIPGETTLEKSQAEANNRLQELILRINIENRNKNHHFKGISSNSSLTEAIKVEIEKNEIELVIIGTQGSTGNFEVLYGSNTRNILEEVQNCPVLAVPSHVKFEQIKEIVLPNGYKLRHHKEDFSYINRLSKKFGSAVRVLHILEDGISPRQEANRKHLALYLRDIEHSFHTLEHVSLSIGIYCFTESRNSDLIAFVNKKHNFLQNLLMNPLYKNLGHYSNVPVLVLHHTSN